MLCGYLGPTADIFPSQGQVGQFAKIYQDAQAHFARVVIAHLAVQAVKGKLHFERRELKGSHRRGKQRIFRNAPQHLHELRNARCERLQVCRTQREQVVGYYCLGADRRKLAGEISMHPAFVLVRVVLCGSQNEKERF